MSASNVIPFPAPPPPAQRVILQPSLHARGARPFAFAGKLDEWHAPGAITTHSGNTRCGVDAAWLVERVLGAPKQSPIMWPGVPGARERALWYAENYRSPEGYKAAPFQGEGAAFLAERDYGILIDEMGIGKSPQAIMAAEARLSMAVVPTPTTPAVLVVCPALAKRHWQAEIKRWAGYDSVVLKTLKPDVSKLTTRYVICNYDILIEGQERDAAGVVHNVEHLPGWGKTLTGPFVIVIFDEGHILRGRTARRTKAAKSLCEKVPVVWALTGTPMPNYVRDLYSLGDIVTGGLFGYSYWKWALAYCDAHQAQYGMVDKGASREDELKGRLAFFMLGRTASGVGLQLPEKRREVYYVDVTVTAPTVNEGHQALNKNMAVMHALRVTARAKRSAVVSAAVEALQAKQKVVVFVYMREQADALAKDIRKHVDCTVFSVSGDMSPDGRYAQAQAFREATAPACFVATIDSMTVSLSLVGAHLVLFGDLVAEPWKLFQCEKRCHRFDSAVRVLVRYMIATGTIDEGIVTTVLEKLPIIEKTIGHQDDAGELGTVFGGKSDEEIIGSLFEKLKSWGAANV